MDRGQHCGPCGMGFSPIQSVWEFSQASLIHTVVSDKYCVFKCLVGPETGPAASSALRGKATRSEKPTPREKSPFGKGGIAVTSHQLPVQNASRRAASDDPFA
ncbi:hypothetical protein SKAU_G00146550 [Synaphobranchus kaupii]|uniref:Uncharacterized protein n=1 Tax=Synaphobranchus kaupii TaxID=118154 RepID=A0A9Q1J3T6_SYNKA|nr:hypothetical protein SKAU_G00146550 [Synaphobranchus kaupii]